MPLKIRICVGAWTIVVLWASLFRDASGGKQPQFNFEEFQRTMMEDWANVVKFPQIKLSILEKSFVQKLLEKLEKMAEGSKKSTTSTTTKTTTPIPVTTKTTTPVPTTTRTTTSMPTTTKTTTLVPTTTKTTTAMPTTTKTTTPVPTTTKTTMPMPTTTKTTTLPTTTKTIIAGPATTTSAPTTTKTTTVVPTTTKTTTLVPITTKTTTPVPTTTKTTTLLPTTTKTTTSVPTTTKTTTPVPTTTKTTTPIPTTTKTTTTVPTTKTTTTTTKPTTTTAKTTSVTTVPPVQACRTRVEFRLWSLEQFKNFSDAMVRLNQKVIDPSTGRTVYQLFIGNHRSSMAPGGHNGPCFPTWHAIYLILFELALQEENPTVCLPYCDWRAEFETTTQCQSSLYTSQYFGNDNGQVTSGFCGNWQAYPAQDCGGSDLGKYLTRRCQYVSGAQYGINYAGWRNIYNAYQQYSDICKPANPDFEDGHNMLHASKGGHLGAVSCAVNDPIFWLIHCFIDMYWNSMRQKFSDPVQQLGTYPRANTNDFPYNIPANQNYNDQALPFTNWTCEMGLQVTSQYGIKYVTLPETCTTEAQCNHTPNNPQAFYCSSNGRCVAKTRIGGSCTSSSQCFRQIQCTDPPVCSSGRCQCATT